MTQVRTDERCAIRSAEVHEPLGGTAGYVRSGYLAIEDPGPWGRAGMSESSLSEVATRLEPAAKAAGVKLLLFREPGRERALAGRRRVIAAQHGHERALIQLSVANDRELLELDLDAFGHDLAGLHPSAERSARPLMLVCTHAKRDQCCAIQGGAIARELHDAHGGQVFECSHLGGHRFAATALLLPSGAVLGRLDSASAQQALSDAGRDLVDPDLLRGLSHLRPAAQAADIALRRELRIGELDEVRVTAMQDASVELAAGGRRWLATVGRQSNPPRPASCGRKIEDSTSYSVTGLSPLD